MKGKTCGKCGTHYEDADANFLRRSAGSRGYRSPCRACMREYNRQWKLNDPGHQARQNAARRERRLVDPAWADKDRRESLAYYQRNREAVKATVRSYRKRNPEKVRECYYKWRKANLPEVLRRQKAYVARERETHRMWARLKSHRRRARLRGAPGTATREQVMARVAYYGGRCWMCGAEWRDIDHVIPISRGGSNWPANLRPACGACNRRKRDRLPSELRAS